MKVVFLAGGISRRMWPLSWDKNLVEFLGRPSISYALEVLKKSGIKDVIIIGSKGSVGAFQKIGKGLGLKTEIVIQGEKLKGQGGAILSAKKYLQGEILICNANDIFDLELYKNIQSQVKTSKPDVLLVGYKVKDYFPGGYLKVKNGEVLGVVEKPAPEKVPSDMVRIVADYFAKGEELVKKLESLNSEPDSFYEEAIDGMIKDGKRVACLPYQGTWKFLKYPWHILSLMEHFLKGNPGKIAKSAKISKKAQIDSNVTVEDGARIFEGAIIRGPAYIGKGAIIGNYALIRESIIGEGTVVGFSSEITRSYIGQNSWFHTNYIGDSVIGDDVSFGSGAITANLRLDEKEIYSEVSKSKINTQMNKLGTIIGSGARIGINAMIMPGVKVGKGSFVGSGILLSKDLDENKVCFLRQEHKIVQNSRAFGMTDRESFRKKL